MAVNKVVLGEDTLIDLTGDTVSADKLSKGVTAHDMSGEPIVGTMEAGGGKVYTFTDGLTETDGTVKWDLNDKIKLEKKVLYGSIEKPFKYSTDGYGFSFSTNVSTNTNYTPSINTKGLVAVRINNTGSYSFNSSEAKAGFGGLTFGNIWGDGNDFSIYGEDGCLTGGTVAGIGSNYNCGI